MNSVKEQKLEIVVFLTGAIVMVLEILGTRILSPYFGSSTYTWTSIIGIIMGSLSLGYYWGGKTADKQASYETISKILLLTGIYIFGINIGKDILLSFIQSLWLTLLYKVTIASVAIFTVPSVLLGLITPYAVRIKIDNLKTSGEVVGNLYAISTLGSIVGTFITGFYLIPQYGISNILTTLSIVTILTSAMNKITKENKAMIILIFFTHFVIKQIPTMDAKQKDIANIETQYSNVRIYEEKERGTGKAIRKMKLDNQNASAMYVDQPTKLQVPYTRYYDLAFYYNYDITKALAIGGAAYSYPKSFTERAPNAQLDVVEIDPKLTEIATNYFSLDLSKNISVHHEDARVFLNSSTDKYDAIFMDAFSSHRTIPAHLTTKEFIENMYNHLTDNGVVVTNTISSINGNTSGFFEAEYNTYKAVFPHVFVFKVNTSNNKLIQNIMLVAVKNKDLPKEISVEAQEMLQSQYLGTIPTHYILTDDYAPIESFYRNVE